jgi:DNA-binding SARP family transcriptional activator
MPGPSRSVTGSRVGRRRGFCGPLSCPAGGARSALGTGRARDAVRCPQVSDATGHQRQQLQGDGRERTQKELLALLLINPDGVPVERAIEALWPEVEPRAGRDRFRTVLSNLRGQMGDALAKLGPPPVERIGAICRIDVAAIDCDLWRFEAALDDARDASSTPQQKRAAYARAADAYGGDLLDGADCAWVEAPREKLRDLAVGVLCRLAELSQADGDDDAAVAALQRAVDLDPYGEETARRLIVVHDRSGNPDAARRAYRRLCRVLQDDLDVAPSLETTALVEDIPRRSGGRARASVMNR